MEEKTMDLSLVILGLAVLLIGFGMLKYRKRSVAKNITSVIMIVVSAVVACVVTRVVATTAGAYALQVLEQQSPDLYTQLTTELPTIAEIAPLLVAMIAAPVLFVFVMFFARILLSIIGIFVAKLLSCTGSFMKKPKLAVNLCLAVVGGLLLCSIYTVPLIGLGNAAHEVFEAIPDELAVDETASFDIKSLDDDYVEPFISSPVVKVVHFAGGSIAFDSLTTYSLESGTEIALTDEIPALATVAAPIVDLLGVEFSEYGEVEAEKIRALDELFTDSALLRVIGTEAVTSVAQAWLNGESFLGTPRPEVDPMVDEVIDGVLEIFEDTTEETFVHDLSAVTDTVAALVETGILPGLMSSDGDVLALLQQEGALERVLMTVYDNEAAHPLLAAILNSCISILTDTLGMYDSPEAATHSFAGDLAEISLKDITVEEMTAEVIKLRDTYHVNWTDEQCAAVAAQIKETPYAQPTAGIAGVGIALLSTAKTPAPSNETVPQDFMSWLNTIVETSSQKSEEPLPAPVPQVVTKQDLKIETKQIKSIKREKLNKLSKELPKVISTVANSGSDNNGGTDSGESSESNPLALIEAVGPVLDVFQDIQTTPTKPETTPGEDSTDKPAEPTKSFAESLMTGILQSQKGQELTGMTPSQSESIVKDVISSQEEEGSSFTDTTKQVNNLVNMINKNADGEIVIDDEAIENAKVVIRDMNKAAASLLKSMLNVSMLTNLGMNEESAEAVSTTIGNLVDAIVNCKSSLDDAAYDKEAEAICSLINMVVAANGSSGEFVGLFDTATTEGRLDMTADAFAKRILDSKILVDTLAASKDMVVGSEDSFSLGGVLVESDKTGMDAALEAAKTQYTDCADAIEVLEAIFGV